MKLAIELIIIAALFLEIYSIATISRQREEMWNLMIERQERTGKE